MDTANFIEPLIGGMRRVFFACVANTSVAAFFLGLMLIANLELAMFTSSSALFRMCMGFVMAVLDAPMPQQTLAHMEVHDVRNAKHLQALPLPDPLHGTIPFFCDGTCSSDP